METGLAVRAFGDRGFVVPVVDAAAARSLADRLRPMFGHSAVSVLPGMDTVVVTVSPAADIEVMMGVAADLLGDARPPAVEPRTVVLPVVYDGADLDAVAHLLNLTPDEVIARHTASTYEVAMLGFAPGFPYLTGLDPALTVPRLEVPRTRVPAGAVGLAAGQTCVYPTDSPGGWRLIGRTTVVLFDPARDEPALLAAGDRVRFEVAS